MAGRGARGAVCGVGGCINVSVSSDTAGGLLRWIDDDSEGVEASVRQVSCAEEEEEDDCVCSVDEVLRHEA